MGLRDFFFGPSIFRPPLEDSTPVKGVEFTNSHEDYFQRNIITVRTVSTGSVGSYATMYRRQPAVRAAVDFLARNIGQLNPKVYERVSGTDRVEVGDHPLAVTLRRPNNKTTRYAHIRDTVADLAIYDRAYWRKLRAGRMVNVVRIAPSSIEMDASTGRRVYRLTNGDEIPENDLVIFHGYSPDGGEDGVSPLETLRRVLQEEAAAVQNREMMWQNSARQSGFFERPIEAPEWSDAARARFREDAEAVLTGAHNAGRFGVLEEGMRWNAQAFSPPTDDYIAGRRLTYEEVAIAYGIPPVILGMGTETKSNAEMFHRQVYQDVLGPWLRMIQDEIELQLLPEFERFNSSGSVYVEFNLAEKLKGSFEEQGKTLVSSVGVPYMTVNEGRARLNLPRIDDEWADTPVQPLNVMYGGQPSVTVPTADPGTAAALPPAFKAAPPPAVLRRRERAAKQHEEFFRRYFERQERTVVAAKAADDRERWDRELTADLYALAVTLTGTTGRLAARQIDGVYDEPRTYAYLLENARLAAVGINAHTFEMLDGAEDAEAIREVFEQSKNARAEQIALGRATTLINFARTEAAKHSTDRDGRPRTKTWVVTSSKSRHPHLNGETVPVSEPFSNGLMWPGDGQHGNADDVAHCQCLLNLN